MNNLLFVLGASDPEMATIEQLLVECGVAFAYAQKDESRVHPGNMYSADTVHVPPGVERVVMVECDAPLDADVEVIRCDHHRPGDPGFGLPPERYFEASSIGQVCTLLGLAIVYAHREDSCRVLADHEGIQGFAYAWCGIGHTYAADGTPFQTANPGLNPWTTGKHGLWDSPDLPPCANDLELEPEDVLMVAAADHCLRAAYAGGCPGVDPDELMRWRAESRAKFQGRSVDEVLADIEAAKEAVLDAELMPLAGPLQYGCCTGCGRRVEPTEDGEDFDYCECPSVRDMRSSEAQQDGRGGAVPELPEAALRLGESYLAGPLLTPDGRRKLVISGTAEEIEAFRDQWAPANGLTDVYAMPDRGMGGGYLS